MQKLDEYPETVELAEEIMLLVAERGYNLTTFGTVDRYLAAQAVKGAEEALEALLVVLRGDCAVAMTAQALKLRLANLFDDLAAGSDRVLRREIDYAKLAEERADTCIPAFCAAALDGQNLAADMVAKARGDVGRGVR